LTEASPQASRSNDIIIDVTKILIMTKKIFC